MTETAKQIFNIQKLYVKNVSFEAPGALEAMRHEWKPEVKLDINTQSTKLEDDMFEVAITVTATTTIDKKAVFLVEVQQVGVFSVGGFDDAQMGHMLGSLCPNILFPYARETISDLVIRGGFPPLYLAPINFDALYTQHLESQGATATKQ